MSEMDSIYTERNRCVAFMTRFALANGWEAGIKEGDDPEWPIVVIDLPTGQVSWHIPKGELHLFDGVPPYTKKWDGHASVEKYTRLEAMGAEQFVGKEAEKIKCLEMELGEKENAVKTARASEETSKHLHDLTQLELRSYLKRMSEVLRVSYGVSLLAVAEKVMKRADEAEEKIRRFNGREAYLEGQLDELKRVAKEAIYDAESFLMRQGYRGSWVLLGLSKAVHKLLPLSAKLSAGQISVCKGDPMKITGNHWVMGDEWRAALRSFKNNDGKGEHTFWYWPGTGSHGAYQLQSPEEVDWEYSGI